MIYTLQTENITALLTSGCRLSQYVAFLAVDQV